MLQDQNIKGFTLLDLLVVISIVALVSAIGMPNFMSWQKDREVRTAAEKIANAINMANTRTANGSLEVVKITFEIFLVLSISTMLLLSFLLDVDDQVALVATFSIISFRLFPKVI